MVGILGGVQSSDTFSVQAGVNRTKAYLLFILAFTAITNSVVGAYCSYLPLRQLIPSFSALLGQLYICLRDLLRGKLAEGYNFGDALLYVTMNVYYYIIAQLYLGATVVCRKPVVPHWDRSGIHLLYSTLSYLTLYNRCIGVFMRKLFYLPSNLNENVMR